jgi:glutamine amidotransferase
MSALQSVVVIDYGSGNIRSAAKAFEHVIADNQLDFDVVVSGKVEDVRSASHIVLPGQGAFQDCMKGLSAVPGMIEALEQTVLKDKKPFLGICVGMQLLATQGLEHGAYDGLGWIDGAVVPIQPTDKSLKIPHMGWNVVELTPAGAAHPALKNQDKNEAHFYFVHSFMFESKEKESIYGISGYGGPVTAIIGRDNILGVQFHPEKSQKAGMTLLHDFLLWNP